MPSAYIERIREANVADAQQPLPSDSGEDVGYFTDETRLAFMASFEADNERIRLRFRPDLKKLFG